MALRPLLFAAFALIAVARPAEVTDSINAASKPKNFDYFGVNESGPEFAEKKFPGIKGKDVWQLEI